MIIINIIICIVITDSATIIITVITSIISTITTFISIIAIISITHMTIALISTRISITKVILFAIIIAIVALPRKHT